MSNFFVFDTNSLISAALLPDTTSKKALDKAIDVGILAVSNSTFEELIEVLFCRKFNKYLLNDNKRWVIINKLEINSVLFNPDISITDCVIQKTIHFLN